MENKNVQKRAFLYSINCTFFLLGHTKIETTLLYAMDNQNNVKNSHRKYIS